MATCILDYLSQPNPVVDNTNSGKGSVTHNTKWAAVTETTDWTEFNYETLMSCYGAILRSPGSDFPPTSPPLSKYELEISDEDSLEHLLSRSVIADVRFALCQAWSVCYPNNDTDEAIDIGRGGRAKNMVSDDSRWYPDWAGVQPTQTTAMGYKNLCPGDTKLSTKWSISKKGRAEEDFTYPLSQVQTYCGRQWNVRYGYLITQEELCVVRVAKESVGPGLAVSRPARSVTRMSEGRPGCATDRLSLRRDVTMDSISSGTKCYVSQLELS
jgi:hypothetical protein